MAFSTAVSFLIGNKQCSDSRAVAELISNRQFILRRDRLQNLKQFLFDERVVLSPDELTSIDLGNLNNLRYSFSGRPPTEAEWSQLDRNFVAIAAHLGPDLKRKARIYELGFFFSRIPLIFLLAAIISTASYILLSYFMEYRNNVVFGFAYTMIVIIWALAQGGLGACAFLGTAVILQNREDARTQKSPEDILSSEASDITDRNFLKVRIILGALFGFLFGATIGNYSLGKIANAFVQQDTVDYEQVYKDLALIFIPFLVGFSTNLVLVLFNRLVAAIQTLFGVQTRS
jgi:hypothetical protein